MARASLVPSFDADVHLVLCDFGTPGVAYVETDPAEADAGIIVENLLHGQYERPLRVLALNADEGWARDVSEAIATKVSDVAEHEGRELMSGHEFNPDRSIVGLFMSVPGTLFLTARAWHDALKVNAGSRFALTKMRRCSPASTASLPRASIATRD